MRRLRLTEDSGGGGGSGGAVTFISLAMQHEFTSERDWWSCDVHLISYAA